MGLKQSSIAMSKQSTIRLNLTNGTFKSYRKPDEPKHPPNIIKQVPIAIEKFCHSLKKFFKYQGYNHAFSYNPTPPNDNNQNKKQWHNSSFDKNVSTNIGKNFLYIIRKHFPRIFKVPLNFNKNNVKVSYGCMSKAKSIISSHNRDPGPNQQQERTCNCIRKETCPMKEKCLTDNVIYEATITTPEPDNTVKKYNGLCDSSFKKGYANHKKSFKPRTIRTITQTSIH